MSAENATNIEDIKKLTRNSFALIEREFIKAVKTFKETVSEEKWSEEGSSAESTTPKIDFAKWGRDYVDALKSENSEEFKNIKESAYSLMISLGVSEKLIAENILENKVEVFEQLLGEAVSVFALVFAWKQEDKIMFSQAIGQIGVASLFASNPLTGLVALGGLALGYNRMFHAEAFKKGGILGLVGLGVATLFPGGIVISFLAALVAVVFINKKLDVNANIEEQIQKSCSKVKDLFYKAFQPPSKNKSHPCTSYPSVTPP